MVQTCTVNGQGRLSKALYIDSGGGDSAHWLTKENPTGPCVCRLNPQHAKDHPSWNGQLGER